MIPPQTIQPEPGGRSSPLYASHKRPFFASAWFQPPRKDGDLNMPSKSNYVCLPCEKEMEMIKSGVVVEEHMDSGKPYKIWMADLWECPTCERQCILGFGNGPIAEHFEDDYAETAKTVQFHIR